MTTLEASLVIPTYGRDHVLLETTRRVLTLDPSPAELLIVDQSPRHCVEVELELQELDRSGRVRWIRLDRPSIPAAMNRGLSLARHGVVIFLDDDVIPAPVLVSAHVLAQREAGIVAGQVLQPGEEPVPPGSEATVGFSFRSSLRQPVTELMAGNFSLRRTLALQLGGFDERFVAVAYRFEQEFADRARRAGETILFEPEASIRHLRAPSGGTRAYGGHLRTMRPHHAVGGYYYLLRSRPRGWPMRVAARPWRAIRTRHHLRRPWWILPTLLAEGAGLFWALKLFVGGPSLLRDADRREERP
jgi:GT2 family glycosyltransferase